MHNLLLLPIFLTLFCLEAAALTLDEARILIQSSDSDTDLATALTTLDRYPEWMEQDVLDLCALVKRRPRFEREVSKLHYKMGRQRKLPHLAPHSPLFAIAEGREQHGACEFLARVAVAVNGPTGAYSMDRFEERTKYFQLYLLAWSGTTLPSERFPEEVEMHALVNWIAALVARPVGMGGMQTLAQRVATRIAIQLRDVWGLQHATHIFDAWAVRRVARGLHAKAFSNWVNGMQPVLFRQCMNAFTNRASDPTTAVLAARWLNFWQKYWYLIPAMTSEQVRVARNELLAGSLDNAEFFRQMDLEIITPEFFERMQAVLADPTRDSALRIVVAERLKQVLKTSAKIRLGLNGIYTLVDVVNETPQLDAIIRGEKGVVVETGRKQSAEARLAAQIREPSSERMRFVLQAHHTQSVEVLEALFVVFKEARNAQVFRLLEAFKTFRWVAEFEEKWPDPEKVFDVFDRTFDGSSSEYAARTAYGILEGWFPGHPRLIESLLRIRVSPKFRRARDWAVALIFDLLRQEPACGSETARRILELVQRLPKTQLIGMSADLRFWASKYYVPPPPGACPPAVAASAAEGSAAPSTP